MLLKEFIERYYTGSSQGYVETTFELTLKGEEGFVLPEGFEIIKDISKIPVFIIFKNAEENAIIIYEPDRFELVIYDNSVCMEATIDKYREYFNIQFGEDLKLSEFCAKTAHADYKDIMDLIINEIYYIRTNYSPSANQKVYIEDLMILLRLFTGFEIDREKIRKNFIRDTYSLLKVLKEFVVADKKLKLIKICDVYITITDETYYVLKNDYKYANKYIADDMRSVEWLLEDDGWSRAGYVTTYNEKIAQMYCRDKEVIAVWED